MKFVLSVLFVGFQTNGTPVSSNGLPLVYHLSGVIQLPYAEINEPFEAWMDSLKGLSRIDYYGGKFIVFILENEFRHALRFKVPPKRFNVVDNPSKISAPITKLFQCPVRNGKKFRKILESDFFFWI